MCNIIDINVGEMAVGSKNTTIRTGGIGSCIVICLYDEIAKVGGMAHSMLPSRSERERSVRKLNKFGDSESLAKYVDEAIERLIAEVEYLGGKKARIVAKLVGGASMFKFTASDKSTGIGAQNLEMALKKLAEFNIPIDGDDTGGTIGRMAEFNIENGVLSISIKI